MPKYRALTDLCIWDGSIVQAGESFDAPASWPPATHACDPLDPEALTAYWNQGPRFSEVEIWRQCYSNCNRWTGRPVSAANTWWIKVDKGYVLRGAENLGVRPLM